MDTLQELAHIPLKVTSEYLQERINFLKINLIYLIIKYNVTMRKKATFDNIEELKKDYETLGLREVIAKYKTSNATLKEMLWPKKRIKRTKYRKEARNYWYTAPKEPKIYIKDPEPLNYDYYDKTWFALVLILTT